MCSTVCVWVVFGVVAAPSEAEKLAIVRTWCAALATSPHTRMHAKGLAPESPGSEGVRYPQGMAPEVPGSDGAGVACVARARYKQKPSRAEAHDGGQKP